MKQNIYADLHNHTTASDGDFSPEELIDKIKSLNIFVVGVTDHDTDKGLERAFEHGKTIGVKVIPGTEISVSFKESFFTGTLHLLFYFHPELLNNQDFRHYLKETLSKGRGDNLVRARIKEINKIFGPDSNKFDSSNIISNVGINFDSNINNAGSNIDSNIDKEKRIVLKRELTFEDLSSYSKVITRRHFALALSEKHNIKNPEDINTIIGNDSPAYLPSGIPLDIVSRFLLDIKNNFSSKFPFLTVLAHPAAGSFPNKGHYKEVLPPIETVEKLVPDFIEAGINGIEINYPGHIEYHREILREWAYKHNLFITGGSDCHDADERPPGVQGITKEEFDKLPLLLH